MAVKVNRLRTSEEIRAYYSRGRTVIIANACVALCGSMLISAPIEWMTIAGYAMAAWGISGAIAVRLVTI